MDDESELLLLSFFHARKSAHNWNGDNKKSEIAFSSCGAVRFFQRKERLLGKNATTLIAWMPVVHLLCRKHVTGSKQVELEGREGLSQ